MELYERYHTSQNLGSDSCFRGGEGEGTSFARLSAQLLPFPACFSGASRRETATKISKLPRKFRTAALLDLRRSSVITRIEAYRASKSKENYQFVLPDHIPFVSYTGTLRVLKKLAK